MTHDTIVWDLASFSYPLYALINHDDHLPSILRTRKGLTCQTVTKESYNIDTWKCYGSKVKYRNDFARRYSIVYHNLSIISKGSTQGNQVAMLLRKAYLHGWMADKMPRWKVAVGKDLLNNSTKNKFNIFYKM
jgi:hypothetical protein